MTNPNQQPLVRWADLLPEEFLRRQQALPGVYLPLGLCEPHGHIAPFGLDTFKADYLCDEAARRFGVLSRQRKATTSTRLAITGRG